MIATATTTAEIGVQPNLPASMMGQLKESMMQHEATIKAAQSAARKAAKPSSDLALDKATGATVAKPKPTKTQAASAAMSEALDAVTPKPVKKAAAPKAAAAPKPPKAAEVKAEPKPRILKTVVPAEDVIALLAGLELSKSDLARALGCTPSLVSEWVGAGRKSGLNATRWEAVQEAARDSAAKRDAVAAALALEALAAAQAAADAAAAKVTKAEAK